LEYAVQHAMDEISSIAPDASSALLQEKAAGVVGAAVALDLKIVTVESCTAGRVAAILTDAPRASDAVFGGYVVYSVEAKERLGVPPEIIEKFGPVSEQVARLLAEAGLARSKADVSIAITGVAGPTTDDDGNPVGLVFLATSRRGSATKHIRKEYGTMHREAVLTNAINDALALLAAGIREKE
jgi:nicotinamide-nucleotide amidase